MVITGPLLADFLFPGEFKSFKCAEFTHLERHRETRKNISDSLNSTLHYLQFSWNYDMKSREAKEEFGLQQHLCLERS